MHRQALSGAFVALALLAVAALPGVAAQSSLNVRSVGEIFVDAQGRASGQNLATVIAEGDGAIEGFTSPTLGTEVFESIRVEGFSQVEKIQGVGSSSLTLRGTNAIVSLHDNVHSLVKIHATAPTSIRYTLAPGITATQEGAHGGIVKLRHETKGELGHLVALGAEGAASKGEALQVKPDSIVARVVAGSDVVFVAKPVSLKAPQHQQALVAALAEGSLASQYVTEFEGSEVATSQVDHAPLASIRTSAGAAGGVSTLVRASAHDGMALAYDLAYETLSARNASDVAVYVDGQLATRAQTPKEVLSYAKNGVAAFHALVESGRSQVLVATPDFGPGGEHRVTISASAQASTEPQAQAEESADDDARVYGGFEYHSNGKLTGDFVTSVLPDGRAQLLGFTALPARTEVFGEIVVDGGAKADFISAGVDTMRLETPKADLTLVDDVHATILLAARAPVDATFTLASGIRASADGDRILLLEGPNGPAGALVATEGASLSRAASEIRVHLQSGGSLVYRGAPDQHESEDSVLRALADGEVGAQLLAGSQDGRLATKATSYSEHVIVSMRPEGHGGFVVDYLASDESAPRAFVLDARGASLLAKSASDVRVSVDGLTASPVASPEEAFDFLGIPRYHASTSQDGALRIIVNTASAVGRTASVSIESIVNEEARAQARTDAFGAFKLFHDGTAIGSFVTLKADQSAGAVTGLTMVATGQPVFASLVAGESPYFGVSGDASSVLALENREARLEFSDTTSGFSRILATSDTSAAFRLAAGLHAEQRGPEVVELLDAAGAHVGSLVLVGADGASSLEERGEREVHASLSRGASILFRAHAGIETELSNAQRTMINQAIAAGHIAGQVIIQTQASVEADVGALEQTARTESEGAAESVAIAAREAYGEVTSAVTASYGAVSVVTAATKNRVDITVASTMDAGQTLLVSLDPETIPGMADGKAVIKFDGEVVAQAASYADILDPNDDGGAAEYFVLAGEAGTQVLVSIPHFSVHTVTLEEQTDHPNSLYMWATVLLGTLVLVETALLARNARAKKTLTNQRRL